MVFNGVKSVHGKCCFQIFLLASWTLAFAKSTALWKQYEVCGWLGTLSLLTPNNRTMATKTQRNEIPIRTKAMNIARTLVYLTLDCRPEVHHAQLWKTNPSRTHKSCRGKILFFSCKILSTKEGWSYAGLQQRTSNRGNFWPWIRKAEIWQWTFLITCV